MSKDQIVAAADGSALGNPGPAGWAWYVDETCWASGGWEKGTNNMGELKAVLDLFQSSQHLADHHLHIICDSKYTIDSITKWMPGWKKKGWKKSDGKPVLNLDLMQALDEAISGRDYSFEWVKGHAGHNLNEIVDDLARAAATAYRDGKEADAGPGFRGLPSQPAQERAAESKTARKETESKKAFSSLLEEAQEEENKLLSPEVYGDEASLAALLAEDFSWITPRGVLVDRAGVLEHRHRAFALVDEPERVSARLLGETSALLVSRVTTSRGKVVRSSIWVRGKGNSSDSWQLSFRQETAC